MANRERTKILEMVAAGELTIEQAEHLLESLGAQRPADADQRSDQRQRAAGFADFTKEQIAHLSDYEIDADYVQALQAAGLTDLTVKQLIASKNYEVDAGY